MLLKSVKNCLMIVFLTTALSSCGGGGGGGSVSGAAFVRIQALPATIDTADRTTITLDISDIHENGIALKVKFPTALKFVNNSAFFKYSNNEVDTVPSVNTVVSASNFLVFYIAQDVFGNEDAGSLIFELQGVSTLDDAEVGVDADVDDPEISNDVEFVATEPAFDAEDSVNVRVRG